MNSRIVSYCSAFFFAVGSQVAVADDATKVERLGFPLGEKSRLHTSIDTSMMFDSNPGRVDTTGSSADVSDWRLVVRPGLHVDVPGSSLSLKMSSHLSVNQFFGVHGDSKTQVGGDIGVGLVAGSERSAVSFTLDNVFMRTPAVVSDFGGIIADEARFQQWTNNGRAFFTFRPGGGALEFDTGYTNELQIYDELTDSIQHGALVEARLRFLPKTAAFVRGELKFFDPSQGNGNTTLRSTPLDVRGGLRGQITRRIRSEVSVGYGDSLTWTDGFFSTASDTSQGTVVAKAELGYAIGKTLDLVGGYTRQVQAIILLDSFVGNAGYMNLTWVAARRLQLRGSGRFEFRDYATFPDIVRVVTADAGVNYDFFDFLSAGIGYRLLLQDTTDGATPPGSTLLLGSFTRHQVFFTASLHY
jgi:hypothetical protein